MGDNWQSVKLGDVITFKRGYDLPTSLRNSEGPFPVVSSAGFTGRHTEAKVGPPGVVTGRYGTTGEIFYVTEPFWPLNTTLYVEDFKGNDSLFVYFLLQIVDFEKYSGKTGVPGVNRNELHQIPVMLPPLPEQRKIAVILSTWDEAITLTVQLIAALTRRKQALMQLLLTGAVRFSEFEGEWEEKRLGEFLTMKARKVEKPATSYLGLGIRSHGKGTFTKVVEDPSTVEMDYLYEVRADDLIVNITFAWEGAIALVAGQDEGKLVSHRFPTYEFDRSKVISEFFKYLMVTEEFFFNLGLISPGGAGRNRVMSKKDFLNLTVEVPSVDEQQMIGGILGTIDEYIVCLSRYLEARKSQKRGLMQQLLTGAVRVQVEA